MGQNNFISYAIYVYTQKYLLSILYLSNLRLCNDLKAIDILAGPNNNQPSQFGETMTNVCQGFF